MNKIKKLLVFSLISAVTLFSTCVFCAPGKRTYVGSEIEGEEEISKKAPPQLHIEEQRLAEQSPEQTHEAKSSEEQDIAEQSPEQTYEVKSPKEQISASSNINEIILAKRFLEQTQIPDKEDALAELEDILGQKENPSLENTAETSETQTAVSQPVIISHEGIPLKWEYKN